MSVVLVLNFSNINVLREVNFFGELKVLCTEKMGFHAVIESNLEASNIFRYAAFTPFNGFNSPFSNLLQIVGY